MRRLSMVNEIKDVLIQLSKKIVGMANSDTSKRIKEVADDMQKIEQGQCLVVLSPLKDRWYGYDNVSRYFKPEEHGNNEEAAEQYSDNVFISACPKLEWVGYSTGKLAVTCKTKDEHIVRQAAKMANRTIYRIEYEKTDNIDTVVEDMFVFKTNSDKHFDGRFNLDKLSVELLPYVTHIHTWVSTNEVHIECDYLSKNKNFVRAIIEQYLDKGIFNVK